MEFAHYLYSFIKGSLRYNELKAEMLDITDTVLSRTLKINAK